MTVSTDQTLYEQLMATYYAHRFDYVPGLADNNVVELGITFDGAAGEGSPTELTLYGADVVQGGFEVTESVNPPGEFKIGTVATKSMSLKLNNYDGRFDSYDFVGHGVSVAVNYKIGGSWEALRYFSGYVSKATETYSNVLELSISGDLDKLDRGLEAFRVFASRKVGEIVDRLNTPSKWSGTVLSVWKQDIPTFDELVPAVPTHLDSSTTDKDVLGWLAQMSGCFAHDGDHHGIALEWYDRDAFTPDSATVGEVTSNSIREYWRDGGLFDDGNWGQSGFDDGGTFDWSSSNYANMYRRDGLFFSSYNYHVIGAVKENGVSKERACLNEVLVLIEDKSDGDKHSVEALKPASLGVDEYKQGDYYIALDQNPFYDAGGLPTWSRSRLYSASQALYFRPFKTTCLADPRIRLGDPVAVVLSNGLVVKSYVTEYRYGTSGMMTVGCEADSSLESYQDAMAAYRNWMK